MRIVVDFSSVHSGGGAAHRSGWLRATAALDQSNEYLLIGSPHVARQVQALPPNFQWQRVRPPHSALARLIWEQTWLPLWLRAARPDVLFSTADRTVLAAPCPTVVLQQNVLPYVDEIRVLRLRDRVRLRLLRALTHLSALTASRLIFVSEAARAATLHQLTFPRERTAVVYHGIDHRFHEYGRNLGDDEPAPSAVVNQPYLLNVSAFDRHKRLETLYRGLGGLMRDATEAGLALAIAGPVVDRAYAAELAALASSIGIADRILPLSGLPVDALPGLYGGAEVVVSASGAESFGLPLVEALACGAPVVASRLPATVELCGELPLYYPTGDARALTEALVRARTDTAWRRRVRRDGPSHVAHLTWPRAARQTLNVLVEAAR